MLVRDPFRIFLDVFPNSLRFRMKYVSPIFADLIFEFSIKIFTLGIFFIKGCYRIGTDLLAYPNSMLIDVIKAVPSYMIPLIND